MILRRIIDDGCVFAVALSVATPAVAATPASDPMPPAVSHGEAPAPEAPEEAAAPTTDAAAPAPAPEATGDAGAPEPLDEMPAPTTDAAAPAPETPEREAAPTPSEPEAEAAKAPQPDAAPTPAPRIEHPSQRTQGLALIALGAIGVFVGWHFIPPGLVWRRTARKKLEERRQMGAPAAQIEESEGRVKLATTLVVGGAVLAAACVPLFIVGVVRQEKGGNKTKVYANRSARRLQPSVGVGRSEATMGMRLRF